MENHELVNVIGEWGFEQIRRVGAYQFSENATVIIELAPNNPLIVNVRNTNLRITDCDSLLRIKWRPVGFDLMEFTTQSEGEKVLPCSPFDYKVVLGQLDRWWQNTNRLLPGKTVFAVGGENWVNRSMTKDDKAKLIRFMSNDEVVCLPVISNLDTWISLTGNFVSREDVLGFLPIPDYSQLELGL
ncbi:MAG: hypothetical protein HC892_00015 [Saprospiraceae bacterium]|nr:hypothetical protein [Saprospiraceae bacterium]